MRSLVLSSMLLTMAAEARSEVFSEENGIVVIEAESTRSRPGRWLGKTTIQGFTGKGYIEFTGNKPTSGPPNSPLEYYFKIQKPGLYYLHMRASREDHGQRKDYSNDCYVRVEGDYGAGPNLGNQHGKDAPINVLKKDTKFFGGGFKTFDWFSGNHLDLGGHRNKRVAVFEFKPGRQYKLIVSGRSKHFCIDRIVFRHTDVDKREAEDLNLIDENSER